MSTAATAARPLGRCVRVFNNPARLALLKQCGEPKPVKVEGAPRPRVSSQVHLGPWKNVIERTEGVIVKALDKAVPLRPGEKQADPDYWLPVGELPPHRGAPRVKLLSGLPPRALANFIEDEAVRFHGARDVLHFSGEAVLPTRSNVVDPDQGKHPGTKQPRLPLDHSPLTGAEVQGLVESGMDVNSQGVKLQGDDFLMAMLPLRERGRPER